jgi:hypothetical protein
LPPPICFHRLYAAEHIDLPEKTILAHFSLGLCDWYICEYDGGDLIFGFAGLNGDLEMAEWGFIWFSDLKAIKVNGIFEAGHAEDVRNAHCKRSKAASSSG